MCYVWLIPSYQLYVFMLDVTHGWLASAKFMVDVDLVLCFSTLHISVWSAGEISTWYQWASWFVEKILHGLGKYKWKVPFKCVDYGRVGHFSSKFPSKERIEKEVDKKFRNKS